jgi:uncharacterized protein (DUF1501 family)
MHVPTRRAFLTAGSVAGLGLLDLPGLAPAALCAAAPPRRRNARADAVIQIHLAGGLSHIDTFDPKPDAPVEVRGPFAAIESKGGGEPLGELLPRTAAVADKIAVIRSMTHTEADHDRGAHSVLTGYQPSPAITYPALGAVVAQQLGGRNDLPPYVCVPAPNSPFFGAGWLGTAYGPFAVGGNPGAGRFRVRDLAPPQQVDEARRLRRKQLLHDLDASCPELQDADAVAASEEFYRQAWALIESAQARAAFDLRAEPDAQRERYGRRGLGLSCLLARRLVVGGARWVVAAAAGFDHHARIQADLPRRMAEVDQAFAALVADLDEQGLLDRTLVLLTTEFGRTPRVNGDAGRDHWSRVFSVALAGGGVRRGCSFGRSNASGAEVERDPVRPTDLAATVFTLLGIDPARKLMAPGDRPIDLVRDGRVLDEVLA